MAVTAAIRQALYDRAGGKCECSMRVCAHHRSGVRCNAMLRGPWEAHHQTAGGPDTLSNLTAMCQRCHRNTRTYGRG